MLSLPHQGYVRSAYISTEPPPIAPTSRPHQRELSLATTDADAAADDAGSRPGEEGEEEEGDAPPPLEAEAMKQFMDLQLEEV